MLLHHLIWLCMYDTKLNHGSVSWREIWRDAGTEVCAGPGLGRAALYKLEWKWQRRWGQLTKVLLDETDGGHVNNSWPMLRPLLQLRHMTYCFHLNTKQNRIYTSNNLFIGLCSQGYILIWTHSFFSSLQFIGHNPLLSILQRCLLQTFEINFTWMNKILHQKQYCQTLCKIHFCYILYIFCLTNSSCKCISPSLINCAEVLQNV